MVIKMLVILSKSDPIKLDLASDIVSKTNDSTVIILSDAFYLALDGRYHDTFIKMQKMGAKFYAVDADVIKRIAGKSPSFLNAISYEQLVNIIIENGRNTINL